MAADHFLMRGSNEALEALNAAGDQVRVEAIGSGDWLRVHFSMDLTKDRLGDWLLFAESKGLQAEPDYQVRAAGLFSNDPLFQNSQQPYLDGVGKNIDGALNISALWGNQTDISAAPVTILDTGLRSSHVEFQGQLWVNPLEMPNNGADDDGNGFVDDINGYDFVNDDPNPWDDSGHGTHVAGLIGASGNNHTGMSGVGWQAQLMPVKVLDNSGNGTISTVVEGIHYTIGNGAKVMLIALETEDDSAALRDALQDAQDADIVWSVPAGNRGQSLMEYPLYPAVYDFPNQITVGSHDLNAQYSDFSNYGIDHVDISAPGNDLLSTGASSDTEFIRRTGTSQASALAAGVLAHLRSAFPDEPGWRLIQRLKRASPLRPISNVSRTHSRKDYVATGRLESGFEGLLSADSAPGNDDLESAVWYDSPAFVSRQTLLDAGAQDQEPDHGGVGAESSVWVRWAPRMSGEVTLKTDHSAVSIAVYRLGGTYATLMPVASASPANEGAVLTFPADAKVPYHIAINAPYGTTEAVRLELSQTPENNDYSSATPIPDELFSTSSTLHGFLTADSPDIWYEWTSPRDGLLRLNPQSEVTAILRVYDTLLDGGPGDLIEELPVSSGTPASGLSFQVEEGQTYAIRWTNLKEGNGYVAFNGAYEYAPYHADITLIRLNQQFFDSNATNPPLIPPENDDTVRWGDETLLQSSGSGGSAPLKYEWFFNGNFVLEGRNLYIPKTVESHAGEYVLKVSNPLGMVTSDPFELKVVIPPITVRMIPDVINRAAGGSASVYADIPGAIVGSHNLKWYLNGDLIQNSSNRELELTNLTPSDTGVLRVLVANQFTSAWSQEVILKVTENPLSNWKRVLPMTPGLDLDNAFFAGGRFFATSDSNLSHDGALYTSPDGVSWNKAELDGTLTTITGIAYGNGKYVAVGGRGSRGGIAVSDDGVFWEFAREELGSSHFSSVVFGNGIFVTKRAISWDDNTVFFTSSDGVNWSTAVLDNVELYNPILFGNGTFLTDRFGVHYTSTDGSSWLAHDVSDVLSTSTGALTYHDGFFYKLSGSGFTSMGLYRSVDGISWDVISGPGNLGVFPSNTLYYDGEYFIATNSTGPRISTTGTGFTTHSGNLTGDHTQGSIKDFAIGNGTIIGITETGRILSGSTVTDLTFDEPIFTRDFHRLEALDDVIVGLGSLYQSAENAQGITWSYDGLTWEINDTVRVKDIAKFNDLYYAIGSPNSGHGLGNLMSSPNLVDWTMHDDLSEDAIFLARGNNRLVVTLAGNKVATSIDGRTWTDSSLPGGESLAPRILRFLNGEFWGVGNASMYRSADGLTWEAIPLSGVRDIAYTDGSYFAAVGAGRDLFQSTNGVSWTQVAPEDNLSASRLKAKDGRIIGANFGTVLYSEDQLNWTLIDTETSAYDVAFFNQAVFYVGHDGYMFSHGDPVAGPVLEANLVESFSSSPLHVGKTVQIPYTASSIADTLTLTLYVDGIPEDVSSDGSMLEWTPSAPGLHEVWLETTDSNGLRQRTRVVKVNVRSGATVMALSPSDLSFTTLFASDDRVWIGTVWRQLYMRDQNATTWQALDLPKIDRIRGMVGGVDGRKYLYGSTFDAFGVERGVVLRSRDGMFWENFGSQFLYPVIAVHETDNAVFAITLDLNDSQLNFAPSQLLIHQEGEDWTVASSVDTLRSLVGWQGRIYAKDLNGDIQVSDDGLEWSEEFSSGSTDTRAFGLLPSDDALLFIGSSRVYHNRTNGQEWGSDLSHNRALSFEGIAYVQTNSGVFTLSPDGGLNPTSRFSTLSIGSSEWVKETAAHGQQIYWLTIAGQIFESNGNAPDSALNPADFDGLDIRLIEGIPFRVDSLGVASTLESDIDWSSASFQAEAEAKGMKSFAYGDGTALFVGNQGVYRHNTVDDTWSLLPNTQDTWSLAYSDGRFWLVGEDRADYSDDGGSTWNTFYADLEAALGDSLTATRVIADGDRVAIHSENRNILYSMDQGSTWLNVGRKADQIVISDQTLFLVGGTQHPQLYATSDGLNLTPMDSYPFGFFGYFPGSGWRLRDYRIKNGIEYAAASSSTTLTIFSRPIGGAWQMLLNPAPVTSTRAVFAEDGDRIFLATDSSVREIVLHNISLSLTSTGPVHLGVGDISSVQIEFTNEGHGPAPAKDRIRIMAMLQPAGTSSLDAAVQIGEAFISLSELAESESQTVSMNWRIPDSVDPGSYDLRITAIGLGDAFTDDNTVSTESNSVSIAARTVHIEAKGSGLGTVENLDPRESYPDKFPLLLRINPDPGYVYSAGSEIDQSVSSSSLTTVILDDSFNGSIYFEPSYETWAAEQIASPADRGRGSVVGSNPLPNIFKYLLGISADAGNPISALEIRKGNENSQAKLRFRIVHGRENEPFSIKVSDDLDEWNSLQPLIIDEGNWILFETPVPESMSDRAFFRLETP
ncbi:MAG: S8 family serine peptidase [Kiritimatiellia bacterium]